MTAWTGPVNPATVDVDRAVAVTVTWEDGHVSRFDLEDLRVSCPCAECRGLRELGDDAWPRPGAPAALEVATAAQVGNWGLNLHWNDGHTTGIYTWEVLRAWCPCPVCTASPPLPETRAGRAAGCATIESRPPDA